MAAYSNTELQTAFGADNNTRTKQVLLHNKDSWILCENKNQLDKIHVLGQIENEDWQKNKKITLTSMTCCKWKYNKFKCRIFTMQKKRNKYYFEQ